MRKGQTDIMVHETLYPGKVSHMYLIKVLFIKKKYSVPHHFGNEQMLNIIVSLQFSYFYHNNSFIQLLIKLF
jgi:hypothetical protein